MNSDQREVAVVGGGVVGLACARVAQRQGWQVTVIDRQFEGDRASHGNAGGVAVSESTPASVPGVLFKAIGWLSDPLGPLSVSWRHAPSLLPWLLAFNRVSRRDHYLRISNALAALNRRALGDFAMMLDDVGLSGDLYRRGAITVYESDAAFAADAAEWALKRELGVSWEALSQATLREMEPGLAPVFKHAVMLSDWSHVADPKRIVDGLRDALRRDGATLIEGEARAVQRGEGGVDDASVILADGRKVGANRVVVAAGAWSAALAESVGDPVLLESERGYNTTLPHSYSKLNREVIFAERKFVATPLDIGLRIGGAAEFAGLTTPPNYRRSDALLTLGRRFIPNLDERDAVRWMGHRPTTPDSLPVIGRSPNMSSVLYAFGHGHLGLTQSATTAALIGTLLEGQTAPLNLAPYSINRFAG
jgi:D-amino-acid dehydrogenase